jgi:AP endonuclease-2
MKDSVRVGDSDVSISDLVNPPGTFRDGKRLKDYSPKDIPALSAKLIPEFDRRRNIKDMFARKNSLVSETSKGSSAAGNGNGSSSMQNPANEKDIADGEPATPPLTQDLGVSSPAARRSNTPMSPNKLQAAKRPATESSSSKGSKRGKTGSTQTPAQPAGKGQQSLKGFLKPKTLAPDVEVAGPEVPSEDAGGDADFFQSFDDDPANKRRLAYRQSGAGEDSVQESSVPESSTQGSTTENASFETEIHDPILAKESWTKLFTKRPPPRCAGHDEPCVQLTTKKPGVNCGRAFWICPRYVVMPCPLHVCLLSLRMPCPQPTRSCTPG